MLYDMEGLRVPVERPEKNLGVLASRDESACRILLWNYHHEEHPACQVNLEARHLGPGPLVQRFYRLDGLGVWDINGVIAMRKGEKRLVDEQPVAGDAFTRDYHVGPHAVCLIELARV